MKWRYDSLIKEYQLVYNQSVLARIQSTPRKKGGITVTTLISGIYYGIKKQKYLEKRNKEWVAYRKKFPDKDSAKTYIDRKKEEVFRFIQAREKEG